MNGRTVFRWGMSVASLVFTAGLLASAPASAATPATAATSGEVTAQACTTKEIYVPNKPNRIVSMRYSECRRTYNGVKQSSTAMWLWDNKEGDGKCAVGRVTIGSWKHKWQWCDATKPSPKYISGWHNGADAKVTLEAA